MNKRRRVWDMLTGVMLTVLLFSLVTQAGAALSSKWIEVYTGSSIYIDGVELHPTDANGKPVEVFSYNGTTYVPLRAVSESLGKAVKWDGATQSVYIGLAPGMKQYLLSVCPPYETDGVNTPTTITMAGQKYANCMTGSSQGRPYFKGYAKDYAFFNLNGQYKTLDFDVGHIDGAGMYDAELNIYLDGELSFSKDLTGEMMPQHISIPLNNALQMKIEFNDWADRYGLGNIEIY